MPPDEEALDALTVPLLAARQKVADVGTPSTAASLHCRLGASVDSLLPAAASPVTPQQQRKPVGPGVLATGANLTGAIFGAGILSMPYAFRIAGWAAAVAVVVVGCLTASTAVLITHCLERALRVIPARERHGEPEDWPLIGYAALGPAGRRLVNGVFLTELYFILMAFLVVNGSNAQLLMPSISRSVHISVSGVLSFAMLFFPFWVFSYFFAVGHIAMATTIALMAISGMQLPEFPDPSEYLWVRWEGLGQAVGILIFCNVAHGTVPSMYMPCSCKRRFPGITQAAFGVVAIVYILTGASGYFFFGGAVQQNIVSNLGKDLAQAPLPGLESLSRIASVGFVVKLQTSFPMYATPLVNAAEAVLGLAQGSLMVMPRIGVRAVLMLGTTGLAVLLQDNMADCIALTGSLLSMCTAIIFPSAFYFLLYRKELSRVNVLLLAGTCAVGVYFQITGTRDSLFQLFGGSGS